MELTEHRVHDTQMVLGDTDFPEMDGAVPESFGAELDKERHRAERTQGHEHIVGLTGEVGVGRVPGGEKNVHHFIEPLLDLGVFLQGFVPYAQPMPALWARDEHGLHGGGEAFQRQTGGGIEEEFGVFLARIAASGKEVAAGKDAFCDFAPVRLPCGALRQKAFVAFEQVFSGASHSDEIGGRFGLGWVDAVKKWKKS